MVDMFSRFDVIDTIRDRDDEIGILARNTSDSEFLMWERPASKVFYVVINNGIKPKKVDVTYEAIRTFINKQYYSY